MNAERIDVMSYAGRKGDERPSSFNLRGLRIDIVEILEHWLEEGFQDRARKRCFLVRGNDGMDRLIYYDENKREWYCQA